MKIVLNKCHGGYSLSIEAMEWLLARGVEMKEEDVQWYREYNSCYHFRNDRTNPLLVECVETLGSDRASGPVAELEVHEFQPVNYNEMIREYDGAESFPL